MKIDAFLFLQRSDLAHFVRVADAYAGMPLLFIDPGLADEALQQGVDPRHFDYRPLAVGRHLQSRITSEALTRAAALDQALTRERSALLGEGLMQGWDQGPLRLFFIRALTARYLGEIADRTFREAAIGVFRPSRPQQFYFDSFVAVDLFTEGSKRWRVVDAYDETANWVADATAMCFDFEAIRQRVVAGTADAVTHIPTCYAHLKQYGAEIVRAFPCNVDLPSPYWDIPVRRDRPLWQRIDALPPGSLDPACVAYGERARAVIAEHLAPLFPRRDALATQVAMMAEACRAQALNYRGLLDALRGAQPHFVVTDHDTGSNGPLFTLAERLGSPITVLPHSSYPTGAIPHPVGVRVIERDGFATPTRTVWGEKVLTRGVRLGPDATQVSRRKVGTVCLLLNTMHSQGLSYIDFAALAVFHRALRALCERHRVDVIVRTKPRAAGVSMVSQALGVSLDDLLTVIEAPIAQVASLSDLCVSYGEPTTAGIEFLAAGSYLMHSGEQLWPSDYLTSPAWIGDGTVPSFVDAAALRHVEALLADDSLFHDRASEQAERFQRRLSARDGRIFDSP